MPGWTRPAVGPHNISAPLITALSDGVWGSVTAAVQQTYVDATLEALLIAVPDATVQPCSM